MSGRYTNDLQYGGKMIPITHCIEFLVTHVKEIEFDMESLDLNMRDFIISLYPMLYRRKRRQRKINVKLEFSKKFDEYTVVLTSERIINNVKIESLRCVLTTDEMLRRSPSYWMREIRTNINIIRKEYKQKMNEYKQDPQHYPKPNWHGSIDFDRMTANYPFRQYIQHEMSPMQAQDYYQPGIGISVGNDTGIPHYYSTRFIESSPIPVATPEPQQRVPRTWMQMIDDTCNGR